MITTGSTLACGGSNEPASVAATVPDTALLSAEAVKIGQFQLSGVHETEWRDAWQVPGRVTVDPGDSQSLGSIVEGRVLEVRVFPGDRVKTGEIVAVIHSHEVMDARQRIVAARADAVSADSAAVVMEAAAARAERLFAAKAMSQAELERTRAARVAAGATREAADAELERAKAFVEHLVGSGTPPGVDEHAALIRAPFDGIVTRREVSPGQVVLLGQPLVTVAREGRLGVLLRLPEEAVGSAAIDVPVRFSVPAYPGRTFDARVRRISPVVDSLSRAVDVWALATPEGQRALRAEMTADAELLGVRGTKVLAVPANAVQVMGGDTVVVVGTRLGEGLLIEARAVRLGRRTSVLAEVLAGVGVGDSVVERGAALAKAEIVKRRAPTEGGHE
ncbi:MAG: hypothetical protein MNPFHGCM_02618 [Gemmatimonadaceae bacterium]|nr:hypothetical protein [Gemmatimonadaceae bacterium]